MPTLYTTIYFTGHGVITQNLMLLKPGYTGERICKELADGKLFTTVQEGGEVIVGGDGKNFEDVVAKIVDSDASMEYDNFEVERENYALVNDLETLVQHMKEGYGETTEADVTAAKVELSLEEIDGDPNYHFARGAAAFMVDTGMEPLDVYEELVGRYGIDESIAKTVSNLYDIEDMDDDDEEVSLYDDVRDDDFA